jgi:hypothetical protein
VKARSEGERKEKGSGSVGGRKKGRRVEETKEGRKSCTSAYKYIHIYVNIHIDIDIYIYRYI